MNQTMQDNIQRGKFSSGAESAYRPMKARIEQSERSEFWADFKPTTTVQTKSKFLRDKKSDATRVKH